MSSLSDALSAYQDYRPSISFFNILFNQVSRTPKISLLKIDSTALKGERRLISKNEYKLEKLTNGANLVIQHAKKSDPRKVIMAAQDIPMGFSVIYDDCTFFDKSNRMSEI